MARKFKQKYIVQEPTNQTEMCYGQTWKLHVFASSFDSLCFLEKLKLSYMMRVLLSLINDPLGGLALLNQSFNVKLWIVLGMRTFSVGLG